jgi:hypothetical protein
MGMNVMRLFTQLTLGLNVVVLLFIGLWLLVGGGGRGYFYGGAAAEVDGVLLLFLTLFNLLYLLAVYLVLPAPASPAAGAEATARQFLSETKAVDPATGHAWVRTLAKAALALNGVLLLFIGLWLLMDSGGRGWYFRTNALEVDVVLLLFVTLVNLGHMGLTILWLRENP